MALSTKAVTVFATLEALRDKQVDIRYPLATLFEPDLAKFNDKILDTTLLADEINSQYHLDITKDVIESFIPIFQQRGWLREILNNENAAAYIVQCQQVLQMPTELVGFQQAASDLAKDFREFVAEISPLSHVERNDSELIDSLVDFLLLLDRAGGTLNKSVGTHYKVGNKLVLEVFDAQDVGVPSEEIFLSARFVQHLFETGSHHIDFLTELSEVGLVTEVVRDFQKPSSSVKKTDLAIYLDAPIAMDFLGMSGTDLQNCAEQMFARFRDAGGSIRIFRESISEIQSSLNAVLARPVADRTGPTADALRRREVLEQFVREVASRPENFLKQKGISIVEDTLNSFPNSHKFFSKDAYELLYSQVGWVKEDVARHHDAVIAAMAFRRRGGGRTSDVFESKHVVLTKNPYYPQLARRIAREQGYISNNHVGPVVHMRDLATAIWLRMGARAKSEIPRSNIISACRRILTLRRNIVEKVNEFKSSLSDVQAEQLEILMSSDRSTQMLMDKTLGSSSLIDERSMPLLLEEMKKAQIAEYALKRDAEEAVKIQAAKRREDELKAQREVERQRAELAEEEASKNQSKIFGVYEKIVEETNRKAKRDRWVFICVLTVGTLVAAVLGLMIQGFSPAAAFFGSITIALLVSLIQFVSAAQALVVDPLFERRDFKLLEQTALSFGLTFDEVLAHVQHDGRRFSMA